MGGSHLVAAFPRARSESESGVGQGYGAWFAERCSRSPIVQDRLPDGCTSPPGLLAQDELWMTMLARSIQKQHPFRPAPRSVLLHTWQSLPPGSRLHRSGLVPPSPWMMRLFAMGRGCSLT